MLLEPVAAMKFKARMGLGGACSCPWNQVILRGCSSEITAAPSSPRFCRTGRSLLGTEWDTWNPKGAFDALRRPNHGTTRYVDGDRRNNESGNAGMRQLRDPVMASSAWRCRSHLLACLRLKPQACVSSKRRRGLRSLGAQPLPRVPGTLKFWGPEGPMSAQ